MKDRKRLKFTIYIYLYIIAILPSFLPNISIYILESFDFYFPLSSSQNFQNYILYNIGKGIETSAFQRRFNPPVSWKQEESVLDSTPRSARVKIGRFIRQLTRNSTRQLRIPALVSAIYLGRVATNFRGGERLPPFSTGFVHVSKLPTARSLVASGMHRLRSLEWRGGERCVFRAKGTRRKISRGKRSWSRRQCASTLVERSVHTSLNLALGIFGIFGSRQTFFFLISNSLFPFSLNVKVFRMMDIVFYSF